MEYAGIDIAKPDGLRVGPHTTSGRPAVTLVESPTARGAGAGRLISRVPEWAHVVQDGGRGSRLPDPKNWARGLLNGNRPCRGGVRGLGEPAGKHAVLIVRAGSWMSSPAPKPEPS
jgi:hypothetical protein